MQLLKVLVVVISCLLAFSFHGAEAQHRRGGRGLGKLFQIAKKFPETCQAECAENELPIQVLVESETDCPDLQNGDWSSLSNAVKPWQFCSTEVSNFFERSIKNSKSNKNLRLFRI